MESISIESAFYCRPDSTEYVSVKYLDGEEWGIKYDPSAPPANPVDSDLRVWISEGNSISSYPF